MSHQKWLGKAIHIAVEAHRHQTDKGGMPYILHPLHLMNQCMFDLELAMIAVMHDVVEDSKITFGQLRGMGFTDRVVDALELLTHQDSETYEEYIDKICTNYDAIRVKRKDIEHNSDVTRLKGVRPKDLERIEKYHRAFLKLGEARSKFK